MKKICLFLLGAMLMICSAAALAEDVPVDESCFPDGNFRAYVAENLDTDGSGALSADERNAVTSISVGDKNIASLNGIGYFPRLQVLECNNNRLTGLDVSSNPALTWLDCGTNQLTRLDVSGNPALEWLACSRNQLTSLDVSGNPALARLYCNANQLSGLNVSANPALLELYCNNNRLTGLDVSACTALQRLECSVNQLTRLNVSGNRALIGLWCGQNQLTSVDVSANTALVVLECGGNQLSVTAVNGAYDLSALPGFDAARASQWNGGTVSGAVLTVADSGNVTYSYDCGNGYSAVFTLAVTVKHEEAPGIAIDAAHFPDENFRAYVAEEIDGNKDGALSDDERNAVTSIDVKDRGVASLQGIACFPNLTELECQSNQLTSLDMSGNPALQRLYCQNNQLTSLDVRSNTKLGWLECFLNQLTELDVSNNKMLNQLYCRNNLLTHLDVSQNTALWSFSCDGNRLTSLDVSSLSNLTQLYCYNNQLTSLDLSANTRISVLYCYGNQLSVTAINGVFDLSALPGFDAGRASQWNGGTVSGTKLTVAESGKVTYTYDLGNGKSETFTLAVTVTHTATEEPTPIATPTAAPTPTAEPTAEPTLPPTAEPTPTPEPTDEPTPTAPPRAEYTVEEGSFVYDMNEQKVTGKISHREGTAELETVYARVCFFYRNKTWASFVLNVKSDGTFRMGANTEAVYITLEIVDSEDATGIPDDENVYGSGRGVVIPVED